MDPNRTLAALTMAPELYKILGVPQHATLATITEHYRGLSQKKRELTYDDPTAEERQKEQKRLDDINYAYSILSDQLLRYHYDQSLNDTHIDGQHESQYGRYDYDRSLNVTRTDEQYDTQYGRYDYDQSLHDSRTDEQCDSQYGRYHYDQPLNDTYIDEQHASKYGRHHYDQRLNDTHVDKQRGSQISGRRRVADRWRPERDGRADVGSWRPKSSGQKKIDSWKPERDGRVDSNGVPWAARPREEDVCIDRSAMVTRTDSMHPTEEMLTATTLALRPKEEALPTSWN